jgi:Flp pilus assembly protein TadG
MPQTKTITRRRGTSLIYMTAAMVVFVAIVSLAVDVGHVRVVKNSLQNAADAASRYAASGLSSGGVAAAQSNAVTAAGNNKADNTAVVVDPNNDVEFGAWDSTTHGFTVLTGSAQSTANAVRVTCRRTAARGNPVPLWFAAVIGKTTADVTAQSIAILNAKPISGFVGLSSVTIKNNAFVGSYDSSVTTTPTQANANSKAKVGSNGTVTGGNNSSIHGDVMLGPSGSVSGVSVSGSQQTQSTALAAPTLPAWSPQSNPGGIPQVYAVASATTLPGGSYWFTSLTVTASLTFSGPTVVYINGNADVTGSMAPSSGVPADLTIYQFGSHTFGDVNANGMKITANIIAPNSAFVAKNALTFYGSAVFNTITIKNNANLFYDQTLGSTGGGGTSVSLVQ